MDQLKISSRYFKISLGVVFFRPVYHVLLLLDCSSFLLQNQTLCIARATVPPPQEPS